ncbi:E3 ubiquitin-protein ligase TRIM39-like [Rhinatrema bivittatum]|uniref:E3 ubiquitin-protein ligase TRIM39-like n=1 Tax=Rhinatrema bivittatum TaxID=194408 RepID=UPI0011262112|nr:E3 ubiquitin-protein ligase TRIM39-like [Rhinatrema bivittatum]
MDCSKYAVNVTLDPETAHPELVLSKDGKSVKRGETSQKLPDSPKRFDADPSVLGHEAFTSGRHYWEVEVDDENDCVVGVCSDSVKRKGGATRSPEAGYWAVGLWSEGENCALTSPWSPLPVSERPQTVGILLDYEAGEVSFYDADEKAHLYTFTGTFAGPLRPFFYTYGALKIRSVQGCK